CETEILECERILLMILPPVVRKLFLTSLALLVLGGLALASGPVFWETSKQDDVLKGDARGVSISENGAVTLAPAYSLVYDTKEAYICSSTTDADPDAHYAGTDDKHINYKIDQTGKAAVLADTTETNIVALAIDKQGNLIAGTDSGGLVLRVSPAGKVFALFDSPTQEIHKLTV